MNFGYIPQYENDDTNRKTSRYVTAIHGNKVTLSRCPPYFHFISILFPFYFHFISIFWSIGTKISGAQVCPKVFPKP